MGQRSIGGITQKTRQSDVRVPVRTSRTLPFRALPVEGSPGVSAALGTIELIAERGMLGLGELARLLELPKTTVHRICQVLIARGWAQRDAQTGTYMLGLRSLGIGRHETRLPVVLAFRGVAPNLVAQHDETVCLVLLDGLDAVFVDKEETTQAVRLVTQIGNRLPAFAAASGRVLLADLTDEVVAERLLGVELVTPTGRRLNGMRELSAILCAARLRGFAENDEETALGLYCMAAPIRDPDGNAVAAITFCVPTGRMSAIRRSELLADLLRGAHAIGKNLAFMPRAVAGDR